MDMRRIRKGGGGVLEAQGASIARRKDNKDDILVGVLKLSADGHDC
jgi:hypothetical protein